MKLKRIFALVLTFCMLLSACPVGAFAEGEATAACEHHEHDESCGGLEGSCAFVCEACAVEEIKAAIAALPHIRDIGPSEKAGVQAQLQAIDALLAKLSDSA